MIHDIEIILHIVRSPIVSMDPVGIAVLSKGEDIANVRFHFESGCVANVTASRISRDTIRKIRVFQENAYLSLDYQKQDGVMYGLRDGLKGKEIVRERVEIRRGEPLRIELEAFIQCAYDGAQPKVSGHEAADALDIALEITRRIEEADPRKKSRSNPRMTILWFVAGEASGDARAAEVMRVLHSLEPNLRFVGAGGPSMQALLRRTLRQLDCRSRRPGTLGRPQALPILPKEVSSHAQADREDQAGRNRSCGLSRI